MKIAEYRGFIFDLDGVIWRGRQAVPGAAAMIAELRKRDRKVMFVTNLASESRTSQWQKLRSIGIDAELHEVVTSGYACALYLKTTLPGRSVHVLGPKSLRDELEAEGIRTVEEGAGVVVVAKDLDFNFQKLDNAFQNLQAPGCAFVVCAANPVHPGENGKLHPGGGACAAALQCCIGRPPDVIVGKPNTPMMSLALETMRLPADAAVVVGDLLDLDILAAQNAGIESIYVLSGVGTKDDIERLGIVPTHVLNSVAEIPAALDGRS